MDKNCEYGTLMQVGKRQWIQCSKRDMACAFQRYCIDKRKVVFSSDAVKCKLRNNE